MQHAMQPAPYSSARRVLRRLPALAGAVCAVGATRAAALTLTLACAFTGCVTINIYFPAAAAEKAADRIIEEIYQLRKDVPPAKPADTK